MSTLSNFLGREHVKELDSISVLAAQDKDFRKLVQSESESIAKTFTRDVLNNLEGKGDGQLVRSIDQAVVALLHHRDIVLPLVIIDKEEFEAARSKGSDGLLQYTDELMDRQINRDSHLVSAANTHYQILRNGISMAIDDETLAKLPGEKA